jgi:hypothetical protein
LSFYRKSKCLVALEMYINEKSHLNSFGRFFKISSPFLFINISICACSKGILSGKIREIKNPTTKSSKLVVGFFIFLILLNKIHFKQAQTLIFMKRNGKEILKNLPKLLR